MDGTAGHADLPWLRRRSGLLSVAALVGLLLGVLIIVNAALRAQSTRDMAAMWEVHTVQVQLETQRLLSDLQDAETGQRGFLLTGDPSYLEPYRRGAGSWRNHFENLRRLTADSPAQQRRLRSLEGLVGSTFTRVGRGVEAMARGDAPNAMAIVRAGGPKAAMDAIRGEISAIAGEEGRLLTERRGAVERAASDVKTTMVALLALGVALAVTIFLAVTEVFRSRWRARTVANGAAVAEQVRLRLAESVAQALLEHQETESQLRQAQKMEAVGQLTGGIAHDFNNMLAIVIGSLDLAKRRIARGEGDLLGCLDNAMEGARRAATLTQRMLAFSRQQPLAPVTLDPNTFVSTMSELLRQILGENIRIETVLAGGLWSTRADPSQLENAILNLAVNARDAMPEGGRLTIETANAHLDDAYVAAHREVNPGQYVVVAVSDTGQGMSADIVAKAFDPFFTTKPVGQGTGLGLSQVFGFVKQSGGHVAIYSEVGKGTSIKVYLPRAFGNQESQTIVRDKPVVIPEGDAREIILVVEDEDRVRHVSVEALRDLGYTVRHASGGAEALKVLETQPGVRLLFTDIVMPDMNGRQLAEAAQVGRPDLKVLYTTGYTRNAVVHGGTLDPGVAFLSKPFTIAQLATKVRQVIDQPASAR